MEKAVQAQKKIEGAAVEGAATTEKQEKKTEEARKKRATQQGKEQAELEKKDKEAREKRGKDIEAKAKQAAQGFSKIRNEVLSLAAVFTGGVGIKSYFENAINSAAGLDRMSANLGTSAKGLATWQLAAKNAGGTAEGITAQLKESASVVAGWNIGRVMPDSLQKFTEWGGNIEDLKDGNSYLLARADLVAKIYAEDPSKGVLAASEMAISEDAFNLIKKGSAGVQQLRQEMSGLADEMDALSKPAEEIRKEIDTLGNSFNASGLKIVGVFLPAIKSVADELKNVAGFLGDEQAMDQVGERIAKVFAFFGNKDAQAALDANKNGYTTLLGADSNLNKGEDAELARRRKMAPTIDGPSRPAPAHGKMATPKPAPAAGTPNAGIPRGMRNNNPGNIEYGAFAKKYGATGSDGRFAIFPTMEAGQAAMQALLGGYLGKGHNTVGKVINRWAPGFENNTAAYVAAVSRQIGVGPDQKLNESHLPALAEAISRHENGAAWGRRNAEAAANMPMGAAAAQGGAGNRGNSTSTSETNINGPITISTQATDAEGIAKSLGKAISQYGFLSQANTGLS